MTGEITLRGRVLPIGGLKEKLLARYAAALKTVLDPLEKKMTSPNPDNVKRGLRLSRSHGDGCWLHALAGPPTPVTWVEEAETPPVIPAKGEDARVY